MRILRLLSAGDHALAQHRLPQQARRHGAGGHLHGQLQPQHRVHQHHERADELLAHLRVERRHAAQLRALRRGKDAQLHHHRQHHVAKAAVRAQHLPHDLRQGGNHVVARHQAQQRHDHAHRGKHRHAAGRDGLPERMIMLEHHARDDHRRHDQQHGGQAAPHAKQRRAQRRQDAAAHRHADRARIAQHRQQQHRHRGEHLRQKHACAQHGRHGQAARDGRRSQASLVLLPENRYLLIIHIVSFFQMTKRRVRPAFICKSPLDIIAHLSRFV